MYITNMAKGCSSVQHNEECLDTALSCGILAIYHKPLRCLIAIINWLPTVKSNVLSHLWYKFWYTTAVRLSAFRARTTQFISRTNLHRGGYTESTLTLVAYHDPRRLAHQVSAHCCLSAALGRLALIKFTDGFGYTVSVCVCVHALVREHLCAHVLVIEICVLGTSSSGDAFDGLSPCSALLSLVRLVSPHRL